jgi:hypothetical protein
MKTELDRNQVSGTRGIQNTRIPSKGDYILGCFPDP